MEWTRLMNFLIESRVRRSSVSAAHVRRSVHRSALYKDKLFICRAKRNTRAHHTGILSNSLFSQQEGIECTAYGVKDTMVWGYSKGTWEAWIITRTACPLKSNHQIFKEQKLILRHAEHIKMWIMLFNVNRRQL